MNGKILMFGLDDKQTDLVKKISSALKIKAVPVDREMYDNTLGMLAEGRGIAGSSSNSDYDTLIVFCEVSNKHLDRILARLKSEDAGIVYKAVMTPANSKWSIKKLYFELEREKKSLG